jgi:ATP-binding cassette, subfamily F, member 3
MLLQPSNLLLLDEPTNHLDIRAKDVLLEALQNYTGTLVFVSHDRYFLENLATRVFEVGDGEVKIFPGSYADYLWQKSGGPAQTPTLSDVLIGVPPAEPIPMPQPQGARPTAKRVNPLKLKQMQEQAAQLEGQIAQLESDIQSAEMSLSDFTSPTEATRVASLLDIQRNQLQQAMEQWESVTREIEAIA